MTDKNYTLADASRLTSVAKHKITYLFSSGKLPEPKRINNTRIFSKGDLNRIAKALETKIDWKAEEGISNE